MNFIENESAQKLRGGYYTPLDLAVFLARWVQEIRPRRILEPSCGDGVFFEAFARVGSFGKSQVTAFELAPEEAGKARERARNLGLSVDVRPTDFLAWAINAQGEAPFDAVVGNPPFVRYQYLPEPFQERAEAIFSRLELPFTKHTNAWVPFLLASMSLLRPGGRLAMVVPSEIIHVTHAQALRSYLGKECRRLVIVDPEELWFRETLQGAVILLAEKCDERRPEGLGIYSVKSREFLDLPPGQVFDAPPPINGQTVAGKWTRALLDAHTRALFDEVLEHPHVHAFRDVAQVDVGIVTGANKFFLVSDEVVESRRLRKWAHPMFGRSEHCPGILYDETQHRDNAAKGHPTNFLWFRDPLDAAARAYIKFGEAQDLHARFKCRVRKPWYTVPSIHCTEIGMLKRSHDTPRLILNTRQAYTTDTAYRIRSLKATAEHLVGCFLNPLTALSAELESRHYGGGVLELIPSEIERLAIALPNVKPNLVKLDRDVRRMSIHHLLSAQGKIVLGALGLDAPKQECLLEGWRKLRDRRQRTSSPPL